MTSRMDFDDQLRAWADLGDERLPVQYLNAALAQIDTSPQRRARPGWLEFPHMNRYATYALAAALIVVALISISLFVRPPDVGPTPLPQPSNEASQEPDATPQADATASPEAPLGGGLILVYQPRDTRDPCPGSESDYLYQLFSLDAGTGEQTLLGTAGDYCAGHDLQLQWAPDREHVLMTDVFGQETKTLDTPTAAGRALTFICCDLPTDVWQGGAHHFDGWVLSPAGDRVSAVHTEEVQVPGQEDLVGVSDGIVVANIDGSGQASLSLPDGASFRGWGVWSPDQTALAVAGCNPCNYAQETGQQATAENHEHIFIVPVDGSPVRELLDDTAGWFWTPDWSPDGSTLATVRRECSSQEAPPQCSSNGDITSSLMLVAAEGGNERVIVTSSQLGGGFTELGLPLWSRDGARIAFAAVDANGDASHVFVIDADATNLVDLGDGSPIQWSPDGEWLLVERPSDGLWIMRADGSDARSLGAFHSWWRAAAW
jgi:Tol biopolymer transport system component